MSTPPAPIATLLSDRYRIERELGAGGMAAVWHDYRGDARLYGS